LSFAQIAVFVPAAALVALSPGANNLLAMQHGMRDGVTEAAIALTGRQMVSPENTLLIPDAGNPGVWSFLWDITQIKYLH